jgi:uncharacterized membrane protein YbhN (UPF0104 family)
MNSHCFKTIFGAIYVAVMLCLGLGLLGLLPIGGVLDIKALILILTKVDRLSVFLILLCTFVNFAIVSFRWKLTAEAFAPPGTHHTMSYLFYTALMHLLSQVLPTAVCTFAIRNIAMRFHDNIPFTRGTLSILYDQIYEIMVPLVFVIPSALVIIGLVTPLYGVGMSFLIGLLAVKIVAKFGRGLTIFIVRLAGSVPMIRRLVVGLDFKEQSIEENGTFQQTFATKMFSLAMLRYVNTTLRACLVLWACNLDIESLSIVLAMPLVQLTFILSVTPAAIGFAEWGWVGGLILLQISGSDAASYAIIHRLFLVASVIVVSLAIGMAHGILRVSGLISHFKTTSQEHRDA